MMSIHPLKPTSLPKRPGGWFLVDDEPVSALTQVASVIDLDSRREPTPIYDFGVAAFRAAEIENLVVELSSAVFNGELSEALSKLLAVKPKLERAIAAEIAGPYVDGGDLV